MTDSQVQGAQVQGERMAQALGDVQKLAKGAEAMMPKVPNTMGGMG